MPLASTPSPDPLLIQMVGGDGAPWWGVPMIAGTFLVIGAGLGFLFNWVIEARKQRAATLVRWDENIRENVAKVLSIHYLFGALWAEQMVIINNIWFAAAVARDELPQGKRVELDESEGAMEAWMQNQFRIRRWRSEEWEKSVNLAGAYRRELETLRAEISLTAPPAVRLATDALAAKHRVASDEDFDRNQQYKQAVELADALSAVVRRHLQVVN